MDLRPGSMKKNCCLARTGSCLANGGNLGILAQPRYIIVCPDLSGCRWRSLPHDYPKWSLVYYYFTQWHYRGVFAEAYEALHRAERVRQGRDPHPSAGILDSQSVKTSAVARGDRGYDAGKKGEGA